MNGGRVTLARSLLRSLCNANKHSHFITSGSIHIYMYIGMYVYTFEKGVSLLRERLLRGGGSLRVVFFFFFLLINSEVF